MPFNIVRNDITKMPCDAIVNAANRTLLGGGGVDGAIHRAAGRGLLKECIKLRGCETGNAKITGAYKLPCKYVIHTVGPVWRGGSQNEEELLRSCYRRSLQIAKENGCESVAFPLISAGAYGYPKEQALKIAEEEIRNFIRENDMTVYLVVYDKDSFTLGKNLTDEIEEYISERYVEEHPYLRNAGESAILPGYESNLPIENAAECESRIPDEAPAAGRFRKPVESAMKPLGALRPEKRQGEAADTATSLTDILSNLDESFSEMLLRKIDEKGMTDAQCYKKANIDRKLFSKIRSDRLYKPSKQTAIAFAIALELSLEETKDMLMKAGFALSHSNKFDIIIEFFIERGEYDIFKINEVLFKFDQCLLGC